MVCGCGLSLVIGVLVIGVLDSGEFTGSPPAPKGGMNLSFELLWKEDK